ncbi:hypothetical protein GCM10023196_035720 [Actinoallomurus vinaceus]|uniref:SGNH hydrolase-type esterase domain-containing protein n=1 Tax=Actinoallomurus vinaceus TaxID=1080074 RepID=A0ABP8UCM7_9ACTN
MPKPLAPIRLPRQATPSAPASGFDALYMDTNGKLLRLDSNGAKDYISKPPSPQIWYAFGHSYLQYVSGTVFTTGRMDQQFRQMLDVEFTNWRSYAKAGAHLIQEGRQQAGWAKVMQEVTHYQIGGQNIHGAPYWTDNGAYLLCWGINDIGAFTGLTQAQARAAFQQALRAVLARCRTSVVWDDNYVPASGTVGQPTYGGGFTQTTGTSDFSSGSTLRDATSTTSATITLTLPSDYAGETVVLQFIANAGVKGGTITFSGTAGVTGALSTSNIFPTGAGIAQVPVVKRITTLTSANAGQTIICTVTAIDSGGTVRFDYWGLESKSPNPILVCNTARLTSTGYANYPVSFGDTDVAALNTAVASVVAEFDGMVQIADIDSALNKNATYIASDGLHPNEIGAGLAAAACYNAVNQFVPVNSTYPSASMTTAGAVAAAIRKPRFANQYYTTDFQSTSVQTLGAVGDMYAMPFVVTEAREIYVRLAINQVTAATTTGSSIRWGIYEDPEYKGYPQCLWDEATIGGAASITLAAGLKEQTGLYYPLDPGLWWIVVKTTVVGGGTVPTYTWMGGPDGWGIMPKLGATVGAGATMAVNQNPIAWYLSGQGTGTLPSVFPSGATVVGSCPMIGLIKA